MERDTRVRFMMLRFWLLLVPLWAAGCGSQPAASTVDGDSPGSPKATGDLTNSPSKPSPTASANNSEAWFVNKADEAGLSTVLYCGGTDKNHILESVGSGCAWLDFDEDGRLD